MPTFRGYRSIPATEAWGPAARGMINRIMRGKVNVGGELTLTPGATSTEFSDDQIGETSVIVLSPMSANAAAALPEIWFSAPQRGRVAINHGSSAQADRNFRYIVMG